MSDTPVTPEQLERLIAYAASRLGMKPEQLKVLFEQQGVAGLSALTGSNLSNDEVVKAENLLHNKEGAAQLLNDPHIREKLRKLLG